MKVEEKNKKESKNITLMRKIKIIVESILLVALAIYILYKTHYLKILMKDPRINSFFRMLFLLGLGSTCSVIIYSVYYLPYKGYNDIDDYNQNLVPVSAFICLISFFSSIIAAWPIFKFWGFFINFIFIIGFINLGNIIPKNQHLGSAIMILTFFLVCSYSYYY